MERKYLPDTRNSITKKIVIRHATPEGGTQELDIYVTVGLYENGTPGELFVKAGKVGATISGLLDGLGISLSIALQYGVPLWTFTSKFRNMRFEPEGSTRDPDMKRVTSVLDAVARWLEMKFPPPQETAQP